MLPSKYLMYLVFLLLQQFLNYVIICQQGSCTTRGKRLENQAVESGPERCSQQRSTVRPDLREGGRRGREDSSGKGGRERLEVNIVLSVAWPLLLHLPAAWMKASN